MKYQSFIILGRTEFSCNFKKNPTVKPDKPVGNNKTKEPLASSRTHKIRPMIIQKSDIKKYSNILPIFDI